MFERHYDSHRESIPASIGSLYSTSYALDNFIRIILLNLLLIFFAFQDFVKSWNSEKFFQNDGGFPFLFFLMNFVEGFKFFIIFGRDFGYFKYCWEFFVDLNWTCMINASQRGVVNLLCFPLYVVWACKKTCNLESRVIVQAAMVIMCFKAYLGTHALYYIHACALLARLRFAF